MSDDTPHQAIILHGNPVDGLVPIGPFRDAADANEWADGLRGEWWCMPLESPDDLSYARERRWNWGPGIGPGTRAPFVVMAGNPGNGLSAIGPFDDDLVADDLVALEWSERLGDDWWWMELLAPGSEIEEWPGRA